MVTSRHAVRVLPRAVWTRMQSGMRAGPRGLGVLAVGVGLGAGLGAVVFRYLILWFTILFTGYHDYSAVGHVANPYVPVFGRWFLLVVPVIGGLIYGPLVQRFAPEARGHGVPEVMFAVSEQGGRIRPQVAVIKSLASAICIGSGGSVGREGPIVQIGSALGSTSGQMMGLPESRLRLLVACGAAGGISATFNAPIAGVFFALELILGSFEAEYFGLVVLASIAANVVGQAAFGGQPFLALPPFQLNSLWEYPMYLGLGVIAGGVGVIFIRVLYGSEDLADRVWGSRPEWLRPAVGGILLGVLLLLLPQMYGVGYPVLAAAIHGRYLLWFLLVLLVGKIAATSLTIGIGGSGGVFAPSLFMGAMVGTAYGIVMNHLAPGLTAPAGAYGLVGMGAVFAGAARAPITAVLIIFELTGDYHIILPVAFAIVVATELSSKLSPDTIYTLKLRRRGIDLSRAAKTIMQTLRVRDAMQEMPLQVSPDVPIAQLVEQLADGHVDALPVVDADGTHVGVVTRRDVETALRADDTHDTAGALARWLPTLQPDQSLEAALTVLVEEPSGLPVVGPESQEIVGWLTHVDVLRSYRERMHARPEPSGPPQGR
jgi:chloride channel protein, CIC family